MAVEFKEYLKKDNQDYKASIYYDKGIKYWLAIVPITITKKDGYHIEEFGVFTGLKCDLLLVNRKSNKKLTEAINIAKAKYDDIINQIKTK